MIPITKPFLPPLEAYEAHLKGIWERRWLTNSGKLANELEEKIKLRLGVDNLLYLSSGTTALQMAIKALSLQGEIITTPFSFVATTSSISWEGCTPVFADIDAHTLNASPQKIEEAITPLTSAILVTHVFGNPCDVASIQKIADKYRLKLIYDAAHAFGVALDGKSIFNFGDISICSLHATKFYHSVEGGLLITRDKTLHAKIAYMRNFGFDGPERFAELGINGKNSELHAAMGLINLEYLDRIMQKYQEITSYYNLKLNGLKGRTPSWQPNARLNHSYYPVIFDDEQSLLNCVSQLNIANIFPRRYFYPPLSSVLPYINHTAMPVADNISRRVLCLPVYYEITNADIDKVCNIILRAQNQ